MEHEAAKEQHASQAQVQVTVCNGFSIAISIARCPRIVGYEGEIPESGPGTEMPLDKSSIIPYKWVMISFILHSAASLAFILMVVMIRWPKARLPLFLLFVCIALSYQ